MLIRSQDNLRVYPLDSTSAVRVSKIPNRDHFSISVGGGIILGIYPTEERAVSVLDQICECYSSFMSTRGKKRRQYAVFNMPCSLSDYILKDS